jgi:hypothetical protein
MNVSATPRRYSMNGDLPEEVRAGSSSMDPSFRRVRMCRESHSIDDTPKDSEFGQSGGNPSGCWRCGGRPLRHLAEKPSRVFDLRRLFRFLLLAVRCGKVTPSLQQAGANTACGVLSSPRAKTLPCNRGRLRSEWKPSPSDTYQ